MTVRIINADVMDGLRQLPDESVNCVVTSPPYWGLRDYGVAGQIGLEKTPAEFVSRMVEAFREVRRVLRTDGVCFVNLGDSYAATTRGSGGLNSGTIANGKGQGTNAGSLFQDRSWSIPDGLKPKDLCGIPWRVAFALQDDGWWLRQDIIWAKPNPMPESVTDRCTKAHEYVFLLTKAERYWWDQDSIRDEPTGRTDPIRNFGKGDHAKTHTPNYQLDGLVGRNKRSVWTIATNPFPEAHFATFPPELPELCIKAGCPKGGTVLDPFGGAGTTGLVADRLQRHAILIELNPEYAAMADARINKDRGGLLNVMEAAE